MLKNTVSEKPNIKKILVPAWAVGSIVIIGVLGFMVVKKNKEGGVTFTPQDIANNPGVSYEEGDTAPQQQVDPETQKVIDQVIARVKELAKLEGDAIPDVGRIANADGLREKDETGFYENASNGDFVVRYPNVVFLYSPTEDKIIKAAEINPTQTQTEETPTGE
ncbi:MAG: hypothetical protein ABH814_00870 [bacterium]